MRPPFELFYDGDLRHYGSLVITDCVWVKKTTFFCLVVTSLLSFSLKIIPSSRVTIQNICNDAVKGSFKTKTFRFFEKN